MVSMTLRKTSLTLGVDTRDGALALEINVSAVAEASCKNAAAEALQKQRLDENADAVEAQAAWHERNGHPLAEIMCAPAGSSWNG